MGCLYYFELTIGYMSVGICEHAGYCATDLEAINRKRTKDIFAKIGRKYVTEFSSIVHLGILLHLQNGHMQSIGEFHLVTESKMSLAESYYTDVNTKRVERNNGYLNLLFNLVIGFSGSLERTPRT